jgi:choline kinase
MKAVILAAGKGERLGDKEPKPLLKLFDKPLIDHALDNLRLSGINDVVVVYSDEKVKEHLKEREKITLVYNEAIERGNGYSLFKARGALKDEWFILLMGDHIFDPEILQRLLNVELRDKNILCVDHNIHGKNIEEATKVLVEYSRIIDIGKNIERWNALDTGIFLCDKEVFEVAGALEKDSNAFTISKTMNGLARMRRLFALDITGMLWMDIDTKEDLRKAESLVGEYHV